MKRLSFSDPSDVMALLVRRKWWTIISFLLLFPAVLVVAWLLPGIYVSETMILIEPRDVPDEFVKNLISVSTEDRLSAIQETVLSRTNLLKVIYEFPPLQYPRDDDQRLIERLKNRITIDFQERKGGEGPVYFKIAYQNRDAALAQRVTSRLAALFIEYDSRTREDQVFGTAEFMNAELQKVAAQLAETEGTLRVQKEKHRFELPEQLDTNLRTLDRLQEQSKANTEALDRYVGLRLTLERELSATPPTVTKESGRAGDASVTREPDPLVEMYRQKKLELDQLTTKYTDRHPDVARLRDEVAKLQEQLPDDFGEAQPPPTSPAVISEPNPLYQKLTGQLNEVKTEIAIRERERIWIQNEIGKVAGRIQNTPQREQEISSAQREHEELTKQYESLKGKLADARLAESLESKQKGSQFVILDAANLPVRPTKPNRLLIAVLGFFASLAFGAFLGIGVDVLDQKVWTHLDLERSFGLPVLAEIPEIPSAHEQKKLSRKKRLELAFASGFLIIIVLALGMLYFSPGAQANITRQLDKITTLVQR